MKNKKIYLLLTCILLVCLTGCRDYTAHGRSNDENNTVNEQAIKEENDAVKYSATLSENGMKIWKKIKKLDGYEYSYDKKADTVTLKSEYFEIVSGGKDVKTIYFTIYRKYPLDDEKTMTNLYEVIRIISEELNTDYNEDAIIESIKNVDYSEALRSYKNDYSSNIELFSILWNDGTKDCIDLRIQPRKY
ncbi:MAG: hypothetical protein IKK88_05565 [Oscillospiraceae bacterium]|nr:hypothetical protein [Oscillospiraceae bacterium]